MLAIEEQERIIAGDGLGFDPLSLIPTLVSLSSGLFKGSKKSKTPQIQIGYSPSNKDIPDWKYGGTARYEGWFFATGGGVEGLSPDQVTQILQQFETIRKQYNITKEWRSSVMSPSSFNMDTLVQSFLTASGIDVNKPVESSTSSTSLSSKISSIPGWAWLAGGAVLLVLIVKR